MVSRPTVGHRVDVGAQESGHSFCNPEEGDCPDRLRIAGSWPSARSPIPDRMHWSFDLACVRGSGQASLKSGSKLCGSNVGSSPTAGAVSRLRRGDPAGPRRLSILWGRVARTRFRPPALPRWDRGQFSPRHPDGRFVHRTSHGRRSDRIGRWFSARGRRRLPPRDPVVQPSL
jgi:hypothetical protein